MCKPAMTEPHSVTPTKITPSVAELSTVNNSVSCPECASTFSNSSNRDLHLAKRHKLAPATTATTGPVEFHCPAAGCVYAAHRHFTRRKYVKQHYLKVHAAKRLPCGGCGTGFSTASALARHAGVCGRKFGCGCQLWFNSREALATHARRAGHRKPDGTQAAINGGTEPAGGRTVPSAPVFLAAVALSELSSRQRWDKGIQTELPGQRWAQTQTCRRLKPSTDSASQSESSAAPRASSRKRRSTQTQTAVAAGRRPPRQAPPPRAPPANGRAAAEAELDEAGLLDALWAGQLDGETQTEPEPGLLEQLLDCQTQTEAELDELDASYCHSTTQTCDHFLFPELGCCHADTQTDSQ